MGLSAVILTAAISLSGVTVIDQTCPADVLGEYETKTDTVYMCPDNIKESRYSYQEILRHEVVHAIQHRRDDNLIDEPHLTELVRERVDDGDVLSILINYDGDLHEEFEARVMQTYSNWRIALLLLFS